MAIVGQDDLLYKIQIQNQYLYFLLTEIFKAEQNEVESSDIAEDGEKVGG